MLFLLILTINVIENNRYNIILKVDKVGNFSFTSKAAKKVFPVNGTTICTEFSNQINPQICYDGTGGAIITWQDYRNGGDYNIYTQTINSKGIVQWFINGMEICTASARQAYPQICSDDAGGAIIIWEDDRDWNPTNREDIYAQRINPQGDIQWTINGVEISTASLRQDSIQICSDGEGGAIITWYDQRIDTSGDIYAQKINSSGIVQWTVDGVPICNASDIQRYPQICSDGSGGAIITWEDYRSGSNPDIYAQKINSTGSIQWGNGTPGDFNGSVICTDGSLQFEPQICSINSSDAIITWPDYRNGPNNWDIYAQKINSTGSVQWTANGIAICNASDDQRLPRIHSNGSECAFIMWEDYRADGWPVNSDIYAQKINSTGSIQFTSNGTPICTASYHQKNARFFSDGLGNVFITWDDERSGTNLDVYALKIDATESIQWEAGGMAVCMATNNQTMPQICSDGNGGAIITWQDYRSGSYDIYVQKIIEETPQDQPLLVLPISVGSEGFLGLDTEIWLMIAVAGNIILIIILVVTIKKK